MDHARVLLAGSVRRPRQCVPRIGSIATLLQAPRSVGWHSRDSHHCGAVDVAYAYYDADNRAAAADDFPPAAGYPVGTVSCRSNAAVLVQAKRVSLDVFRTVGPYGAHHLPDADPFWNSGVLWRRIRSARP